MGWFDIKLWFQDRIDDIRYSDVVSRAGEIANGVRDLTTGKTFVEAAQAQLNEDISRLNAIRQENAEITKDINSLMEQSKGRYCDAIKKLIEQKKEIHSTVLKPYIDLMNKLKVNAKLLQLPEVDVKPFKDEEVVAYSYIEKAEQEYSKALYLVPGLVVGHSIVESVKIEFKIDEEKEERERLKSEKAKQKAKCKTVDKISEFLEKSHEVVDELKGYGKSMLSEFEQIVEKKGYDCNVYSENDFVIIQNCSNMIFTLNHIVNNHILKESGIINPVYKKYIEEQIEKSKK